MYLTSSGYGDSLLEFCNVDAVGKKTRAMSLTDGLKRLVIRASVLAQYQHWTDRQTDRQTEMVNQDRDVSKTDAR